MSSKTGETNEVPKKKKTAKQKKKEEQDKLLLEIEQLPLTDYYSENYSLLHGNCLERMKEIPDDSVI